MNIPLRAMIPAMAGLAAAVLACLPGSAHAMEMRDLTLISPITGLSFPVVSVPATQRVQRDSNAPDAVDTLADMGADDDGCRHSSEGSEYEYYIATDPTSYFSALTAEWDDKTGRFRGTIDPKVKLWVEQELNGDFQIDRNHGFQTAIAINKARNLPPPDRATFLLAQGDISIEKRYSYALKCYAKRGARPAALAKVALMGAWAIRTRVNMILAQQSLAGGYEEVNDKVIRLVKEGETFSIAKYLPIYQDIFDNKRLSNEGYLVAGLTYFGLALRDGDLKVCSNPKDEKHPGILERLTDRLKEVKNGDVMRGIVRERVARLKDYLTFTEQSAANFMEAIADEEFTRQHLPETMLVVAECLRRHGDEGRAMDWYLAIARMAETQPKIRDELRTQGKAPGPDAPYAVQLGWIADRHIEGLTKSGLVHAGTPEGPDKQLLNAIMFENLGSAEYQNPVWKPASGATQQDSQLLMNIIGQAILSFGFHNNGVWPKSLGELWERDVIHDRNYVNRFYCPVTGKPYLYQEPTASDLSHLDPKTVLLAVSEPVSTNQGPRYLAFLANTHIVASASPLKPGEIYNQ